MRALVTGAGGFLGRYLVEELLGRDHEVIGLFRPARTAAPSFERPGLTPLITDLRRPSAELRDRLAASDVVFHLAASGTGGWRELFDANVLATENLLQAMKETDWRGRLVHVSTFSVYGLNQVPPGSVIDESTPLEPAPYRRDHYTWTKVLQERVVRDSSRTSNGLVIVRPGVIYGRERRFVHSLGRRAGSTLVLLGTRNFIPLNYVENTASLLAECGHHPRAVQQVFNAVDPQPLRQWQYLRHFLRANPERLRVVPVNPALLRTLGVALQAAEPLTAGRVSCPRFLDPYVTTPNMRRFRYASSRPTEVMGWYPPVPVAEAMRRTFGSPVA